MSVDFFVPVEEMIYPGGEDGAMLLDRVLPVFDEILHTDAKQVAVVCHGGVIRVLLCALFAAVLLDGSNLVLLWKTAVSQQSIMMKHYMDSFWTVLTTARI